VLYADSLFNNPDTSQLETLPELFHRELALKYKSLLELANAGSAATSEELATYLEDARVRFMETNLSTRQDADLTKEQRKNLETHLAELRIGKLRSHAEDISDLESEFEAGRVLGSFNCDDRLTCDSNVLGQSLLGHFVRIET
jgi:hypothetical protein